MKLDIWKRKGRGGPASLATLGGFLAGREMGASLRAGHLEMIPLFGTCLDRGVYSPPESSLGLTQVTHYGSMILKNASRRPTIVPLHLGYFQKAAQNHAMCRSWVLEGGEKQLFEDAACIQEAQGGYIASADERFIILPLPLRAQAFALRGTRSYGKLWNDISRFNSRLGLKRRGHLDEFKQARQPDLLRIAYQLEPQENQTGAIFLLNGKVAGIELAPDREYWRELHLPLVMYCYAPLGMIEDHAGREPRTGLELEVAGVEDIAELECRLADLRQQRKDRTRELWNRLAALPVSMEGSQTNGHHRLLDVGANGFSGQAVLFKQAPSYLSLTASSDLAA